jgi:putative ABC transport system permease protein
MLGDVRSGADGRTAVLDLWTGLRHGARSLRRRPGFTAVAVLILALGIGANSAIFSVVDAVLLRSLPYGDVEELVVVWADGTARGMSDQLRTSPGAFLDWRTESRVFSGLAALRNVSHRITSLEKPVVPLVHAVTANYFDVLEAPPLLGRGFRPGDDAPGAPGVVMLSYALWQSAFGGDPDIVGRVVTLDDAPHEVIGVMPADFHSAHVFAVQPGLWVPLALENERGDRAQRDLVAYARLAVPLDAAQAAMTALSDRLSEQYPATDDRWGARLVPLREHAVGAYTQTFGVLLAAVALVLLIACADVANLTLARAAERSREIALRTALGAPASRIVGQLLAESVLLALLGGGLGLLLARAAVDPLALLIPASAGVPFLDEVAVDGRVVLFTLLVATAAGVGSGLLPARQALRTDLVSTLREGGRGAAGNRGGGLRGALVVAEVALAVVVAAGAGLLIQTFARLASVDPGFDADRILKLRMSLRGEEYAQPEQRRAHFEELQRRLGALPGVQTASGVSFEPPIAGQVFGAVRIALPGVAEDSAAPPSAVRKVALPGYFETMGIPIRRGRGIEPTDRAESRPVVVINEEMARRYFPDRDPIGRSFSLGAGMPGLEIVGVVGNVLTAGTDPGPKPVFYLAHAQNPIPIMSMTLRVDAASPGSLAREAEAAAWAMASTSNVYAIETLDAKIADLNWRTRFAALLLGGFAALALLLGAAGIYAVISYTVTQRRPEISVRLALGAPPRRVLGMVVSGALRLALAGVVLGLLGAAALARLFDGLLYGVEATDPLTLVSVAAALLLVAAAASLAPARRAMRVNPIEALRG